MHYFRRAKPYKIELGESGSWYPLEQNRGVGKITAISVLWISVVEDFLLFPGKKKMCSTYLGTGVKGLLYQPYSEHYSGKNNWNFNLLC